MHDVMHTLVQPYCWQPLQAWLQRTVEPEHILCISTDLIWERCITAMTTLALGSKVGLLAANNWQETTCLLRDQL